LIYENKMNKHKHNYSIFCNTVIIIKININIYHDLIIKININIETTEHHIRYRIFLNFSKIKEKKETSVSIYHAKEYKKSRIYTSINHYIKTIILKVTFISQVKSIEHTKRQKQNSKNQTLQRKFSSFHRKFRFFPSTKQRKHKIDTS